MNTTSAVREKDAPESPCRPARIVGLFSELLGVGGVQEAGRLTAAALAGITLRYGWSVDFLSLNDSPGLHSLGAVERRVSLRGFGRDKVRFAGAAMGWSPPFEKSPARILLAAHPHLAVPSVLAQKCWRTLKTIVMAHGVEVWQPLSQIRRWSLQRADLVLAPSRDTAQKLVSVQGVSSQKVRTLAWPLNPDFLRLAAAPADLPLPPRYPRQGQIVLTVGRWASSERYKGVDDLIRAMAQLRPHNPNLKLVVVGGGDDLPRLREIAGSLEVSDCTYFLQDLSREQIAACYSRADVFALPSAREGFGLVFLEAMAFGKPVIGVAAGGASDVVEDAVNGLLLPSQDLPHLSSALERLIRDDALRAGLGHAGADIVRRKYEFSVYESRLEQILFELGLGESTQA